MKSNRSPEKNLKNVEILDKIDLLEQELLKSKQNEVNLSKKIFRLESLAFKTQASQPKFRSKAPKVLDTHLDPHDDPQSKAPETKKDNKFLTPNNMRIIEAFHNKKNISHKKFRFSENNHSPAVTFHSPPSLEIPIKNTDSMGENKENGINYTNKIEGEAFKSPIRSPNTFIERLKAGAIEVIIEKEQQLHSFSQQLADAEQEIIRLDQENLRLRQSFAKLFEELQFENEDLARKVEEEKTHYMEKLMEKEREVQRDCDMFLNEQVEKYRKLEIMLNSELDEKKNVVYRLERENFLLNMQICELQKEITILSQDLERKKQDFEKEFIKNKAKDQDFIDKISEKEGGFKEKYEEIERKLRVSEGKYEDLKKENKGLIREKDEVYQQLQDLLEEKIEIEKVYHDLKEFSRHSIEKYEKMIAEIQVCFRKELESQKTELNHLKEISLPSLEETTRSRTLMEDLRSTNDLELLHFKDKLYKANEEIDNLTEEVKILENVAIEAKLMAAQASTDRDYFEFKYKQSLEFIKGITGRGEELEEKEPPKQQEKRSGFLKEIVKKLLNFRKGGQ